MFIYELWHFTNIRSESVIVEWVSDEKLSKRDRAILNQKLDRLRQIDYDLAKNTRLLAGPIYGHVYKLVIHGDVMLRPMLCRGPISNETEYTLLLGAIERNWKLPPNSEERAADNRETIINDPNRRKPHERIP
jgi:hypothetical protein